MRIRMRIRVNVTNTDIDQGLPRDCQNCPIALALKRTALGKTVPYLWVGERFVKDCYGNRRATLPKRAMQFIEDLDNGQSVEPFTFSLSYS